MHIRILPPFYNSKEQAIVNLPETVSSSFLFVGEDTILPRNISEIDFAYEVFFQALVYYLLIFNPTPYAFQKIAPSSCHRKGRC